MKALLERARDYLGKLRRSPGNPTINTLVLSEHQQALEEMDTRIARLEALHAKLEAEARDWSVGAKV